MKAYIREISKGIFQASVSDEHPGLTRNIYAVKNGDGIILVNTGPGCLFNGISSALGKIADLKNISHLIIQDTEAGNFSAMEHFRKNGFSGITVTSWRNGLILQKSATVDNLLFIENSGFRLRKENLNYLKFIPSPFITSPGSFMIHDEESGTLFSGSMFSSFSGTAGNEGKMKHETAMKAFHSHMMPSNEFMKPVASSLKDMRISCIAPLFGSIISEGIPEVITAAENCECGRFIKPSIIHGDSDFTARCSELTAFLTSLFSAQKIQELFSGSSIRVDSSGVIENPANDTELWTEYSERLASSRESLIAAAAEPMLKKIALDYSLPFPEFLRTVNMTSVSGFTVLQEENLNLRKDHLELKEHIKATQKLISQDRLTGLYKQNFFDEYLKTDIETYEFSNLDFSFFIIDIDNMQQINNRYGKERGDEIIRNTSYILKNFKKSSPDTVHHLIFKFSGPRFAYFISDCTKEYAVRTAEELRNLIQNSDLFLNKITASIGLVQYSEHLEGGMTTEQKLSHLTDIAEMRVRIAKKLGENNTCSESTYRDILDIENTILLVEPDETSAGIYRTYLSGLKYGIITVKDGEEAIEEIRSKKPVIVISELFIPKSDGFMIRTKMLKDSRMKEIPFILLSHKKNHETVRRAKELEINFYLQKPFYPEELASVIQNNIKTGI